MDPASDTPLHEQMYECAGLPYEILIPHDIGPESFEEQNKFVEKPEDEKIVIQYQREEYLKEDIPKGPYPTYTKGQGWVLVFSRRRKHIRFIRQLEIQSSTLNLPENRST